MIKFILGLLLAFNALAADIPSEVEAFYETVVDDHKNCVVSNIMKDNNSISKVILYFMKNGESHTPNPHGYYYSQINLYRQTFSPSYSITSQNETDSLEVTFYRGDHRGVERSILKLTKDLNGRLESANFRTAVRTVNPFTGSLRASWSKKGLYQYSCKDGVMTMTLGY